MNRDLTTDRTEPEAPRQPWRLADLVALVWRRRILAGGTVLVVATASVVAVLVVTPLFTARATFMPPPEQTDVTSFLRDPLSAVLHRAGGTNIDRLMSFLSSQTTRRLIVERFHLQEHYKAKLLTYAMKSLENATSATVTPEGMVDLRVTDRDPQLAADIANAYVDITDSLYREAGAKHAGEMRKFLDERVDENRQELARAEEEAREFGKRHGVVSLPDQVAALVDQMAQVEAEARALDVKIGATRRIYGPDYYSLREMTIERDQLGIERQSLMEPRGAGRKDPLLSFGDIPDLALEYARLERNIKILSLVQQLLVQQHEVARLDELRTVSSVTRLDRAVKPEVRSWPVRTRVVVLSTAVGIVWAILLAAAVEGWPAMRRGVRRSIARLEGREEQPGASARGDRGDA